jgi:hypothetical protein
MKRDQYKTVTDKQSFAILIPTWPEEAMGEATFEKEIGTPQPVRPITVEELKKAARKLSGVDGDLFFALLALRGALEAHDELMLVKAEKRLENAYLLRERDHASRQLPQHEESHRQFGKSIAPLIGLPPDESLKHWDGLRPGPRAKADPYRLISFEVSQRVGGTNAEIVLWWVNGKFIPAIFCKDVETAIYIHTFFVVPTGGIGFRICPHCSEQFFQDRPNQEYCIPAHREAHRVARWRNEKKVRTTETRTDGEDDGTQETR